jgi:hypothetical protein
VKVQNYLIGRIAICGAAAAWIALCAASARAGLGDTIAPGSVSASAVHETAPNYTVVEQNDSASGATIEQYVAAGSNQVFLVTWHGPHMPDLQSLLSSYFGAYNAALAARKLRSLHTLHVDTGSLVVDIVGHSGDFRGSAWAPALVPVGLDVTSLLQGQ